eukprot:scaffold1957_cov110-Isochrysis_galbana.AAC.14
MQKGAHSGILFAAVAFPFRRWLISGTALDGHPQCPPPLVPLARRRARQHKRRPISELGECEREGAAGSKIAGCNPRGAVQPDAPLCGRRQCGACYAGQDFDRRAADVSKLVLAVPVPPRALGPRRLVRGRRRQSGGAACHAQTVCNLLTQVELCLGLCNAPTERQREATRRQRGKGRRRAGRSRRACCVATPAGRAVGSAKAARAAGEHRRQLHRVVVPEHGLPIHRHQHVTHAYPIGGGARVDRPHLRRARRGRPDLDAQGLPALEADSELLGWWRGRSDFTDATQYQQSLGAADAAVVSDALVGQDLVGCRTERRVDI